MRNWRRSARTIYNPPNLLSAQFVVATRVLTLVFDRPVTAAGVFSATVIRVNDGANRYDWQSTTTPSGHTLVFLMLTPAAVPGSVVVTWNDVNGTIRDSRGQAWPIGTYPVTIV